MSSKLFRSILSMIKYFLENVCLKITSTYYVPGAEMFMRMANDSSCESNPDCAGPAANSDAVKVRYLMRKRASPRHKRFFSTLEPKPRRSHSRSDHLEQTRHHHTIMQIRKKSFVTKYNTSTKGLQKTQLGLNGWKFCGDGLEPNTTN